MNRSLRGPAPARTLLARMAADEARADRIRQLKADHPELTWGYIADQVGVKERSAIEWQRSGGISAENAKRLAEVFDVTYEWLWFGEIRPAPDLMKVVSDGVTSNLSMTDDIREEFRSYVTEILGGLQDARDERASLQAEIERQNALIERQENILDQIKDTLSLLPAVQRLLEIRAGQGEPQRRELPQRATGAERRGGEDRRETG